jgi:hypothetical protein
MEALDKRGFKKFRAAIAEYIQFEWDNAVRQRADARFQEFAEKRLSGEAKRRIEEAEERMREAERLEGIWFSRMKQVIRGIVAIMENRRLLVRCLQPDLAPDDRKDTFTEATQVVNAAATIFAKSDYLKWRPKE